MMLSGKLVIWAGGLGTEADEPCLRDSFQQVRYGAGNSTRSIRKTLAVGKNSIFSCHICIWWHVLRRKKLPIKTRFVLNPYVYLLSSGMEESILCSWCWWQEYWPTDYNLYSTLCYHGIISKTWHQQGILLCPSISVQSPDRLADGLNSTSGVLLGVPQAVAAQHALCFESCSSRCFTQQWTANMFSMAVY